MAANEIPEIYRHGPEPFAPCPSCQLPTADDGRCVNRGCVSNQPREPWPGTGSAGFSGPRDAEFADRFDPPTGYVYVEHRLPRAGDLILNRNGYVQKVNDRQAGSFRHNTHKRHILFALNGTDIPEPGQSFSIAKALP